MNKCMKWILILVATVVWTSGCKKEQPSVSGQDTPSAVVENAPVSEPAPIANESTDPSPTQNPAPQAAAKIQETAADEKPETTPTDSDHGGVKWFIDYEKAKAKAQKEGKDLLINFSGSDWCRWCILLEKEVFSQDEFAKEAEKYFVFMLVDFPNDMSSQTDEVQKQNMQLARMYGFQGYFPTLYVAASDGKPYAKAEYQQGGAKNYLKYLLEIRKLKNI